MRNVKALIQVNKKRSGKLSDRIPELLSEFPLKTGQNHNQGHE